MKSQKKELYKFWDNMKKHNKLLYYYLNIYYIKKKKIMLNRRKLMNDTKLKIIPIN